MTLAVLDDHLLRDVLANGVSGELASVLVHHEPATTNLYYYRLSRSVVSARGGQITGAWSAERRRALGASLVELPSAITIVPMQSLAFRMAEIADDHRMSTLGAEAIAAAEHLGAPLVVWDGDVGPNLRTAAAALRIDYQTISRETEGQR